MLEKMKRFVVEEEGQALTEYGLIIGLIAVLLIGALLALKNQIADVFNDIVDGLKNPSPGNNPPTQN